MVSSKRRNQLCEGFIVTCGDLIGNGLQCIQTSTMRHEGGIDSTEWTCALRTVDVADQPVNNTPGLAEPATYSQTSTIPTGSTRYVVWCLISFKIQISIYRQWWHSTNRGRSECTYHSLKALRRQCWSLAEIWQCLGEEPEMTRCS